MRNGDLNTGAESNAWFAKFFQQTEIFLDNIEPTHEEKEQLLERVFGVKFDSFDIKRQKEKKFYSECTNGLSWFCGTVTYQWKKFPLLDWVIVLWDDGNDYRRCVSYDGSKKFANEFWYGFSMMSNAHINSLQDFLTYYRWQDWKLWSYHGSIDFEFNFENWLWCYWCEEKKLKYWNIISGKPNHWTKYVLPNSLYQKMKNNWFDMAILEFLWSSYITDILKLRGWRFN